jgi:hypothetical protein
MAKRPPRKKPALPGRMLRPKAVVLDNDALVPPKNVVKPPPNRFTHKVKRSQPYFYEDLREVPNGEFTAGTPVVLMVYHGGDSCRVVDEHGLYVETAYGGLHRL